MHTEAVNLFGAGTRFHHVGLAVASIDDAAPGLPKTHDPTQRVSVAFQDVHGAVIELIEPAGERSPIAASLKKGTKLVHLCYEVPDIHAAISVAEGGGMHVVAAPTPAVAFDGRRIAWVYHEVYGLIELLEAG